MGVKSNALPVSQIIYAIYDANGSVLGEMRYLWDKCRGQSSCALCDLSHGWNPLGKPAWRKRKGTMASIQWLHRDEVPEGILEKVRDRLPCIVVVEKDRVTPLINREMLRGCEGNLEALEHLVEQMLAQQQRAPGL